MAKLVLHPQTSAHIERYVARPSHAVLLVGSSGSGKLALARHMAGRTLKLNEESLDTYPYFIIVEPTDGKAIPIEAIRQLQHFTTLKIPGSRDISRLVIIESAHLMTIEAQNALLKTLEEPPRDTAFILTAPSADAVLPTIQSRVRILPVAVPGIELLRSHFSGEFANAEIEKALLVSGGLPGLTHALLAKAESHPLYEATMQARQLLRSTVYERLLLVDSLSKQKQLCQDIAFILGQMSRMALLRGSGSKTDQRWQNVMKAAFNARESLQHNTQTKLILMNLMLEM